MDMRFNCPRCGQHLSVDESGAGMTVSCPNCSEHIEIPRRKAPPPPAPLPPPFFAPRHTPQSLGVATSYAAEFLMPGEHVVYSTRLHLAVSLPLFFCLAAALGLFFTKNAIAVAVGVVLLVFAVIPLAITSLITRATSEFAVTNKRVLIKTGWIRRNSLETLLTKIESIRVDQSVLGRMLDYGTIIISGTGGSKEPFHKIAQPMMFRRRVQDQISASEQLR
jgi:membrane protein YdbS with pleckstrin-like domain/DNA-directed RNA polymerase subunit RPC12/RpoP